MSTPWRVKASTALAVWERTDRPSSERVVALLEWFFHCAENEPPGVEDGALPVPLEDEPTFVYRVPDLDIVVTYYVIVYERLMVIRSVRDI